MLCKLGEDLRIKQVGNNVAAQRITIDNCLIENSGGTGIRAGIYAANNTFTHNTIRNMGLYYALQEPIAAQLDLDPEQRKGIAAAIGDHSQRLRKMSRVNSAQRGIDGRKSYVEAWIDIYDLLTEQQQNEFNRLRGPMPASALPKLKIYQFE